MSNIFLTSDLHFNHNKDFIYKARGFDSVEEMNEAIITNWNKVAKDEDDIYVLGDLMLGDNSKSVECIKELKGNIHIVLGNHDTIARIEMYRQLPNVVSISLAEQIRYQGYHCFLTHYPSITGDTRHDYLRNVTCNFFGHTHDKEHFFENRPFMYNVALDAHNCEIVNIEDAIKEMDVAYKIEKMVESYTSK